jgi:formylglycine-generating enzyme required for sulfatase activity
MSEEPEPTNITNRSGGADLNAQGDINVGGDVVGRDKIIQAGTYIEHATIIQSGSALQETTSTVSAPSNNRRVIGDMEFVRVPPDKFIMGGNRYDDQKPQHTVEILYDYWIARYPVTNEQFAGFVTAAKYSVDQGNWQTKADHPVVNVSWRDAMAYCQWLNDTLHGESRDMVLRLPTEAEWEKAARGTQGYEWPWGNEFDKSKCNSNEDGQGGTTPVGAYSPQGDSPYGAADMVGNVWEWCHSRYKPYPYQANDGRENEAGDDLRVLRGGSWFDDRDVAHCGYRYVDPPDLRIDNLGFRCCVSLGARF